VLAGAFAGAAGAPCTISMQHRRGFTAAAVCDRGVCAGTMASSSGSERAAPIPRSTARREMCFFVMNCMVAPSCDGRYLTVAVRIWAFDAGVDDRQRDGWRRCAFGSAVLEWRASYYPRTNCEKWLPFNAAARSIVRTAGISGVSITRPKPYASRFSVNAERNASE